MTRDARRRGSTGSLWHDTLEPDDDARPRAALPGDTAVDVAIVGGRVHRSLVEVEIVEPAAGQTPLVGGASTPT